jgi:hypothetical protein
MTDSTHPTLVLADRVGAILSEEYEGSRTLAREACQDEPQDGAQLSLREGDLRDWGLIYGLAFGMLNSEAPADADREQLAKEALDAARVAYRRWAGEIAPRPAMVSGLVDAAVLAFDDVEFELQTQVYLHGQTQVKPLVQPMQALRDLLGVPARAAVTA